MDFRVLGIDEEREGDGGAEFNLGKTFRRFYYCSLRFCKGENTALQHRYLLMKRAGWKSMALEKYCHRLGADGTETFYYGFEDSYSFASDDYVMIRLEPEDPEMGDYRKIYQSGGIQRSKSVSLQLGFFRLRGSLFQ